MEKFNELKLFFYQKKKVIIISTGIAVMVLGFFLVFITKNKLQAESVVYENLLPTKLESKEETNIDDDYVYVDIKGAVTTPGVYSLQSGKRVVDAINQAGGLREDANTSLLNLSLEITDGMVIIVYSNAEVQNYDAIKQQEAKSFELCKQDVYNDACIINSNSEVANETKIINKKTTEVESETKINLNTATIKELMTLNRIGEAKAQAIIEYRTQNGNFQKIEDIKNVSGIGDSIFNAIKDHITI